jgi:hypothetical protein
VGARNRLRGDFMRDIVASWEKHGAACLEQLAKNDPLSFARLAAMIVSRELSIDGIEPPTWQDRAAERERANEQLHERLRAIDQLRAAAESPPIVPAETVRAELNEPPLRIEQQPLKMIALDRLADYRGSQAISLEPAY